MARNSTVIAALSVVLAAAAGCAGTYSMHGESFATTPLRTFVRPERLAVTPDALDSFEGIRPGISGVWRSNGYGYLVDLTSETPRFFHITDDLCLPFGEEDSNLFDAIDRAGISDAGTTLIVGASPEPHTYEFQQQPHVPDRCRRAPSVSVASAFDAFADFMAEHYAFFDVHDVDWAAETALARQRLPEVSSDAELFALLTGMIRRIEDGHLSLVAEIDGEERDYDPGEAGTYSAVIAAGAAQGLTTRASKRAFDQAVWFDGVDGLLLEGTKISSTSDWIKSGLVASDVGYFATFTSGGFAARDFSNPMGDLDILESALDDALVAFERSGVRAVIVDASMNHGGHDFISRAIAARFASERVFAYSKFAADASDPYRTDVYIEPSPRRRFTGPVYFLTSDISVSAAEILALSMRALPNVVHVGGTTRGAFSDILEKPLPNGWLLTLSNETYLDHQGIAWEGRGIPPAIPLDVFSTDSPAAGHAEAIRTLVRMARRNL